MLLVENFRYYWANKRIEGQARVAAGLIMICVTSIVLGLGFVVVRATGDQPILEASDPVSNANRHKTPPPKAKPPGQKSEL